MEMYVIKYFDKTTKSIKDKFFKGFDAFEDAMEWGRKNINNFNSEMIRKIYKNGGTMDKNKKIGKVMHEFKEHELKTSYGKTVTNPKQAMAIALSESRKMKKGGDVGEIKVGDTIYRAWFTDNDGEKSSVIIKANNLEEAEKKANLIDNGDGYFSYVSNPIKIKNKEQLFEETRNNESIYQYNKGGDIEDDTDLFEDYDNLPKNVKAILDKYSDEDNDYETLAKLKSELNEIGYTFEYGLDAEPYGLKKMAKGGSLNNKKLKLYKLKSNDKSDSDLLISKDGNSLYIYEKGILYDTLDGKTKGTSHRMSKLDLEIIELQKITDENEIEAKAIEYLTAKPVERHHHEANYILYQRPKNNHWFKISTKEVNNAIENHFLAFHKQARYPRTWENGGNLGFTYSIGGL